MLTSDGRLKRLAIQEFRELSGRAATVLKLKDGVELRRVVTCRDGDTLVVGTSTGRLLRLKIDEQSIPTMGRTAQGPVLMRLLPRETVVGAACGSADGTLLLASRRGQIKRLPITSLRLGQRGDLGQIGLGFGQRDDQLSDLQDGDSKLVAIVLKDGRSIRLATQSLEAQDCSGTGITLDLKADEAINELIPLLQTNS
jgi:DNA gyrase subunit A